MLILCLSLFIIPAAIFAQDQTPPCSAPEFSQFDFWVGEWNLTWNDSLHGTNVITKEYGDCVIHEHFNGNPGAKFTGMSVSTYNKRKGKWQQTWVDDQGGYLDFAGGMVGDSMILSREAAGKDGNKFLQRMVWYNIAENSFDWNWEKSTDEGKNWTVNWKIHYERK